MNRLDSVSPQWAWETYQPSKDNPWDLKAAAHLYRRAGFAASRHDLEKAVAQPAQKVVQGLLSIEDESQTFRDEMNDLVRASLAAGDVKRLSAVWVYRMINTPVPLLEKMTLFWHGHFATSAEKVGDAELMLAQNDLLRRYATGSFSELLLGISRDPAMLVYLDSATNRKAHPNENYAREIMELFCLGEGNYHEKDIRELARCFTGWEVKRKEFRFNRYQHDGGIKTVLGETGRFGGEQGVAIVARQAAAPQFIAEKLFRFFVMDEPQPSEALIQPLAQLMRDSELQIEPVVRRILSSNLFFSPHARARKVRSPAEFAIGFLRALDGSTDSYALADAMQGLGQGLLYPPSVKGWDGGRAWINSSTLVGRSNLIRQLIDGEKTRFGKQRLRDYLRSQGMSSADGFLEWFEATLFAVPIPMPARERVSSMFDSNADDRVKDAVHVLCTLAEFQLG